MSQADDAAGRDVAGRDFVTTCYEVFLGRDLDAEGVAIERGAWPRARVLRSIFESDEFRGVVMRPLARSLPLPGHVFRHSPTVRQRLWAAEHLPIGADTAAAVRVADDWRALLAALLNDERLTRAAGMAPPDMDPAPTSGVAFAGGPIMLEDPFRLWR